uniref:Toxin-antitoxin system, toxin component n=1 Tax=Heterorhabditis bacteriophora TaxID=37862 RepID=A0A1I7WTQ5_HETBA
MITISLRKDLKPLTNLDLEELVKELKIEDFRGVFMRDTLPDKILSREVGIVNLDSSNNKEMRKEILDSKLPSYQLVKRGTFSENDWLHSRVNTFHLAMNPKHGNPREGLELVSLSFKEDRRSRFNQKIKNSPSL